MKKILNHLIQLQEMIEARAQQSATTPNARLEHLDKAIATMRGELPEDLGRQVERLLKKSFVAIVPISNGICTGCGMAIPISMVHAVHAAESLYNCPNCARLLYYPENPLPRRSGAQKSRFDAPKVGLNRFSAPELMIPNLSGTDRDSVISEMCAKLAETGFVENGEVLVEQAFRREAIMSTAVDMGLAFPHVRGVEGGGLTLALGVSKDGVQFGPDQRGLTNIVFFMVIPTAASAFYLKLLSGLTEAFGAKEARESLLAAETPEKLWKALLHATKNTIQ